MWHEALLSLGALAASMSLIEISPFVFHYLGCGCPMLRNSHSEVSQMLTRRDQRIAEDYGVTTFAKHQFTFGLNKLDESVKLSGNAQHYIDAEKRLTGSP